MTTDLLTLEAGEPDEISLLDWLRDTADQNVTDGFETAVVPVAWIGRTSTDDVQDPPCRCPGSLTMSVVGCRPGS